MKYYVYKHFHPISKETVYIGKGTAGRAWACGYSDAKASEGRRGNRTKTHQKWIADLLELGYTPADFVEIVQSGLSNSEALLLERALIDKAGYEGLFNKPYGKLKISKEALAKGRNLLASGFSYKQAAQEIGVSTMCLWRADNNKTKGLKYAKN